MKKRLLMNMASSLLLEIVSLVCAFILPRLIIVNFGSEYNGIVSSVSQFLSVISLLRGGVGGVTRAALYKPLLERDYYKISSILKATEKFMRKIAWFFSVFLLIFAMIYPVLVDEEFERFFTFTLVLILGISTFSQYYFGITYQILMQADQRQYVYSLIQTAATIVNTVLSAVMINYGVEFRIVKLVGALVFGAIPLCLNMYVRRNYKIIRTAPDDNLALKQRWDAFAHHVAAFVHINTDVVLLTLLSDLYQVSVFVVYSMIVNGVKKFVNVCSSGMEAVIGNLLSRDAEETLQKGIALYEWVIHVVSTALFVCTAVLIVPFVAIYTRGVNDAEYFQPILGYLLCLSQFFNCIRLPYQNVVEAAGRYKQTKRGAIIEAVCNIIVSIPCIIVWGSTGAVMGTIVAISFRTIQYATYASKEILKRPYRMFIKRLTVSAGIIFALMSGFWRVADQILAKLNSYYLWLIGASLIFAAVLCVTVIVNILFYPEVFKCLLEALKTAKRK